MIRKQGRLLRNRANRDIAIGCRLQRSRRNRGDRGGDGSKRRALEVVGGALRCGGCRMRRARCLDFLGAFGKPRVIGAKPRGQLGKTGVRSRT
jgi:hypothetical protein